MEAIEIESVSEFLCAPTFDLTCFGCCPPIRPHHYDPMDFVGSLRREFSDNRREIKENGPRYRPIVGYSCWALGFLDSKGRRVGCLLHPAQNEGQDLRHLIDYGDKCRREFCHPARMFALLPEAGRVFWLGLVRGMNAFAFSSRRANPLFHLLLWGPDVLEALRAEAEKHGWTAEELLSRRSFLLDPALNPKAHRYIFRLTLDRAGSEDLEKRSRSILEKVPAPPETHPFDPYTHSLPLEADFLDFVRLGLGREKIGLDAAVSLKDAVEQIARKIGL